MTMDIKTCCQRRVTGGQPWNPTSREKQARCGAPVIRYGLRSHYLGRCRDLIQIQIAHSVAIKRIVCVAFGVKGVEGIAIVLVERKP
jgi:hypothetical protein